jgi:hypothetical protein
MRLSAILRAALIFSGVFSTTSAPAEISARDFLVQFDSASVGIKPGYITAAHNVELGTGWSTAFVQSIRKEAPIYCQTPGRTLNGAQVIDILRHTIATQPAIAKQPYGLAILMSLQLTFPCSR